MPRHTPAKVTSAVEASPRRPVFKAGILKRITTTAITACLWLSAATTPQAAEHMVTAGHGTLADAVAAAAPGDHLILQHGLYTGETAIDKSLLIRALSRSVSVEIADRMEIALDANEHVVLQGLHFSRAVAYGGAAGATVDVLENRFLAGSSLYDSNFHGAVRVVGNSFDSNQPISILGYLENVLVAGNDTDGYINVQSPAWVIGNRVGYVHTDCSSAGESGVMRIIGNRVAFATDRTTSIELISTDNCGSAVVAGNTAIFLPGRELAYNSYTYCGVCVDATHALLLNNVIDGRGLPQNTKFSRDMFGSITRAEGNVVLGFNQAGSSSDNGPVYRNSPVFRNNLCFGNYYDCETANGNLNVDPQFINDGDYRPAPGSPLIDAGSEHIFYSDLDLTRNDIGAYGGPWGIAQFDTQRDPDAAGPWVYPLFDASTAMDANGDLRVKAIGFARLR